jgi:hypothetical protein
MKKIAFLTLLLVFVAGQSINAQKIKILSGSMDKIKSIKEFSLEFDYSDMGVGSFDKEEDYIAKKVAEYNANDPGRGDRWAQSWVSDRKNRFEPKFQELLNKYASPKGYKFHLGDSPVKAKLLVHTTWTEPGFNVYVTRRPAMINVIFTFYDEGGNELLKIESLKNPGTSFGGADYDTGTRIQEAYAKCGKELGIFLAKNTK